MQNTKATKIVHDSDSDFEEEEDKVQIDGGSPDQIEEDGDTESKLGKI